MPEPDYQLPATNMQVLTGIARLWNAHHIELINGQLTWMQSCECVENARRSFMQSLVRLDIVVA